MQYQESYTQFDPGLLELIKNAIPASFASALNASGTVLDFPQEPGLELKLKYDDSEESRAFSLKLSWDNETEEDDEEEDEDEDEDED